MLTPNQVGYLATVPEGKVTHIAPFNPATQTTAQEIIHEVESECPSVKTYYIGSSKLGIAGENDIDLSFFAGNEFNTCLRAFEKRYGTPGHRSSKNNYANWELVRNGFPVEIHLSDFVDTGFQEQLDTQKILESNENLRNEYEQLKIQCDGLPWKQYLIKKYEFWNKVLGLS